MAISSAAELSLPAAGTYEIDPAASAVRFGTRALGLLRVRGTFTITQGRITVAETSEASSVDVELDAASFTSGNPRRDNHVRSSDFLDVARHPTIHFRSRGLERSAEGATLHGELTVCGVTRPVVVTIGSVVGEGERITAGGTASIDRYAFGVKKARGMAARRLEITLDIVASR
ncbi:YceI family protein [Streptomyces rugosispiralis]|uniref:YceI family protein n=1 Tax=Streptomyces rugosispiralis TaxID=2967341 RepID=A0ABT1URE1_9ACTN|nr:YceI family protein [Streptomyces rugosispiralis]MCQ8187140.1 YceI family protein [Streptomyces rugosispiralis]